MYSTCLFCHADLGRNDALEHFPVGGRLAYDAHKGRLWVVCRRCERWNLTPLEERWEAVEEAERAYRETRLRVATDNVGLARLRDGTELVRIGAPLRPEFAVWRYGDQFGRRRRNHLLVTGGVAAAVTTAIVVGPVLGFVSLAAVNPVLQAANWTNVAWQKRRSRVQVRVEGADAPLRVNQEALRAARLVALRDGSFALEFGGTHRSPGRMRDACYRVEGAEAVRVAGQLLPAINRQGGTKRDVQTAVRLLDEAASVDAAFRHVARLAAPWRLWSHAPIAGSLAALDPGARLALEMAAHEEQERRAMDGELAELERAWREAEEIAGIADDLLLPPAIGERLDQLRRRSTARAGAASSPSSDSGSARSS